MIQRRLARKFGLSLLEIVISISLLVMAMAPIWSLIGTTNSAVLKSQNLSLAVGLAHKIVQHLLARPYDSIVFVAPTPLAGGPKDGMFNPIENFGNTKETALEIKPGPTSGPLCDYLEKFEFMYSLDVVGDYPKDVKVNITWREKNRDLLYSMRVYVTKH